MDESGSFPAKISVRARLTLYHDFRTVLVQQKIHNEFKTTCFGQLRHIQTTTSSMDNWSIISCCVVLKMIKKSCVRYDFVWMISLHVLVYKSLQ